MFDDLYSKVREYAQQRRLEEVTRKAKGYPMDASQLQDGAPQWWTEEVEPHQDAQ